MNTECLYKQIDPLNVSLELRRVQCLILKLEYNKMPKNVENNKRKEKNKKGLLYKHVDPLNASLKMKRIASLYFNNHFLNVISQFSSLTIRNDHRYS